MLCIDIDIDIDTDTYTNTSDTRTNTNTTNTNSLRYLASLCEGVFFYRQRAKGDITKEVPGAKNEMGLVPN